MKEEMNTQTAIKSNRQEQKTEDGVAASPGERRLFFLLLSATSFQLSK